MRKLVLLSIVAAVACAALVSSVLADNIKITVDDKNANEFWIQLIVSPQGMVSSIDMKAHGVSFHVPNVDWDHGQGRYFVKNANPHKIPYGSAVSAVANLKNGKKVPVHFTYRKGASGTSGGSSNQPSHPSNPSQPPSHPAPPKSEVAEFEQKVSHFHRNSGYPSASITSEDSLRKRNKDALRRAVDNAGVKSLKARAFLFATFGLESETMYDSNGNAQRDTNKDFDPLYKNFSPLNMNGDMLNHVGYKGNRDGLNRIGNIAEVVKIAIHAVNKLGLEGFLNFHRGGASGWEHPQKYEQKYKMNVYKDGVYNIMQKYMQDSSLFNDGRKVWADIPYV